MSAGHVGPRRVAGVDDSRTGSVVVLDGRTIVIQLIDTSSVGGRNPHVASALGDAAGPIGLGGQPGQHRAVLVGQLVQVVVALVDNPETVCGSLYAVRLRTGSDPSVRYFAHTTRLSTRSTPVLNEAGDGDDVNLAIVN